MMEKRKLGNNWKNLNIKRMRCLKILHNVSAEGSGVTVEGSATFPEEAIVTPHVA
ncbi:hypothetical protein HanRHA438_Chr09g0430171 [Helianthus annuus]|nr:hypothetical protein HanIR_Chr09g0450521 [Helianthus annuus]KAJ0891019.1 hypothetical protein HanRHA438_Chr09g0430171 [Helianthus annuus]